MTRHTGGVDIVWLKIPDLVDRMGLSPSRIRRLVEERALPATRRDGVLVVPEIFLVDDAPMSELKGTAVLLGDLGFDDDEAVAWLLEIEPSLGTSPVEALRAGRKAEVRRIAQALG